jgi:hypothetical protein
MDEVAEGMGGCGGYGVVVGGVGNGNSGKWGEEVGTMGSGGTMRSLLLNGGLRKTTNHLMVL